MPLNVDNKSAWRMHIKEKEKTVKLNVKRPVYPVCRDCTLTADNDIDRWAVREFMRRQEV